MSEKLSKERMLRAMLRFYEPALGTPGYRLPRVMQHDEAWSGWTPAELDELYQEMIRLPFLQDVLEPETPPSSATPAS